MLIFPNTAYPDAKAFIITAVDIDYECYVADTDEASLYKDFWNVKLIDDERIGCIQAMLNALELAYGPQFRIIRPHTEDYLKQYRT